MIRPKFGEIDPAVLEKKIFLISQCIFAIKQLSSLGNQTWILFSQGCFVQSLVKLPQWFWRRWFFKFVNVFWLFHNFSLWKELALHLNKLESPSPKDALCQVWLKLAPLFWRTFFKFVNVFSQYRNYLPLEKVVALHLNKFISPLTKDALCQVWLKLAQRFWRRRYFKYNNVFSQYHNYLPLEKGGALHLNKL